MNWTTRVAGIAAAGLLVSGGMAWAARAGHGSATPPAKAAGVLTARGDGQVFLMMRKGAVTVSGRGDLWVSKSAKVTVQGSAGKKVARSAPQLAGLGGPGGPPPNGARGGRDGGRGPGGPPPDGRRSGGRDARGPGGPPPNDGRGDARGPGGPPPGGERGGRGPGGGPAGQSGYLYQGWNGTATIQGEEYVVSVDGHSLKLKVSGEGTILLDGKGDYALAPSGTTPSSRGQWAAKPSKGQQPPRPLRLGDAGRPGGAPPPPR
jgi:hypothetical protein